VLEAQSQMPLFFVLILGFFKALSRQSLQAIIKFFSFTSRNKYNIKECCEVEERSLNRDLVTPAFQDIVLSKILMESRSNFKSKALRTFTSLNDLWVR
jgi:hypothetical protein